MKPPPRNRGKIKQRENPVPVYDRSRKTVSTWTQVEQKKLLMALKTLSSSGGGLQELNFSHLQKAVPTRSISEIQSVVEFLKNKVILLAERSWKQLRREENKCRRPIEAWTRLASTVAGGLEGTITMAFSQMLLVSSTEPGTLLNCDPPRVHLPYNGGGGPVGRVVPLRPMPGAPVSGKSSGNATAHHLMKIKTPPPSTGLPPSQVMAAKDKPPHPHEQLSTTSSRQLSTGATLPLPALAKTLTLERPLSTASSVNPKPSSLNTPPSSSSSSSSSCSIASPAVPSKPTASCPSPCSTPPLSTAAAAAQAKFGRTSKYATEDSPRTLGVKCVVDFERIYCYLSRIHKPNNDCHLTPMESAIVLDLLMSLPEELSLLDCNKLQEHLIQVYRGLSAPSDSQTAREFFEDLNTRRQGSTAPNHHAAAEEAPSGETTTPSVGSSQPKPPSTDGYSGAVTANGGKTPQPGEAEGRSTGSNPDRTQDEGVTGLCPPLNPFLIPLNLLMRK
ncbi:uncharacterized protein snapc2 [Aulostomus maculatus]